MKSKTPLMLLLSFIVFALLLGSVAYYKYLTWFYLKNKIESYYFSSSLVEKEQLLQEQMLTEVLEAEDFSVSALTQKNQESSIFRLPYTQHDVQIWKKRKLKYELLTLKERIETLKLNSLAYKIQAVQGVEEAKKFYEEKGRAFPPLEHIQQPFKFLLKVYLDEGHGGKDPGAISPSEASGTVQFPEKTSNLLLAKVLKQYLEAMGAEVYTLRNTDHFVSLSARSAKVAEQTFQDFVQLLKEEIAYRTQFTVLDLQHYGLTEQMNQEQLGYFQKILSVLEKETIPFYQPFFASIYEENLDTTNSIFSGYGASLEARLIYDIQSMLKHRIFLSIHANANLDPKTQGTQAYFLSNATVLDWMDDDLPEGYEKIISFESSKKLEDFKAFYPQYLHFEGIDRAFLAQKLYRSVADHLPELESAEGLQTLERYFFVLRTNAYTSVLYETAYISNPDDFLLLQNEEKRARLASALMKGIIDYYSALKN